MIYMRKYYTVMGLLLFMAGVKTMAVGLSNGKLSPCNDASNCAITQMVYNQKPNAEPIYYSISYRDAFDRLKKVLLSFDRVQLVTVMDNYIHATFTSKVFKFVDDVEFFFPSDNKKVIHMRSASRTGKYDFGVNKKRLAQIKKRFEAQ